MTTIKVWADFTCPYCYIAKDAFYRAAKDMGRENLQLEVMSFELNPDQPLSDVRGLADGLAASYGISIAEAEEKLKASEAEVKAAGLPIDYLQARQSNTHDAHRLYHFALTKNLGMAFFDLAQKLYFADGLVLSDHQALLKVAEAVGLDREETGQVLSGEDFAPAVRADHDRAVAKQIQYVPHFVWPDDSYSEGVLHYADLRRALESHVGRS